MPVVGIHREALSLRGSLRINAPRKCRQSVLSPLDRRSRSARASVALPDRATILIRDGSWNALTVLHELSHLVSPDREPHGADFVATELALVRRFCGFDAFATLASTFVAHGVAAASVPLASARGAD